MQEENKNQIEVETQIETNSSCEVEETKQDDLPQVTLQESTPKVIEIKSSKSAYGYLLGALIIFGVCFVCSIFLFQVLFTPIGVIGGSMLPTINASATGTKYDNNIDTVYYTKTRAYKSKDIVIIKEGKTTSGNKIIKRIVATPGQTIMFKSLNQNANYFVVEYYVDGILINDDYTLEEILKIRTDYQSSPLYAFHNQMITQLQSSFYNNQFSVTLGEDEYFVMGDNRNNSTDSRMFGPVKYDEIDGVVLIHVKYGETLVQAIWTAMFGNYLQILPIDGKMLIA